MFNESDVKTKMEKVIENMEMRFTTVRAGRANPNILNGVMVEYYGAPTPLNAVSTISVPEARQLMIKPFDRGVLGGIEKAIFEVNLGITPNNNGESIILSFPFFSTSYISVYTLYKFSESNTTPSKSSAIVFISIPPNIHYILFFELSFFSSPFSFGT